MTEPKALNLGGKVTTNVKAAPSAHQRKRSAVTRSNFKRSNYIRRGGNYYNADDGSLIEDLVLLALIAECFDDPAYQDEAAYAAYDEQPAEPVYEEPAYSEPESTYESTYESSDSSWSDDSGSDDSGSDD
jgi:hypothetical protein